MAADGVLLRPPVRRRPATQRTKPGETEPGLPSYGTVELSALREIGRNFDVFFGVQNLFDEEYYVGFAPTTIGTPRLVNGGIRVRWSGR